MDLKVGNYKVIGKIGEGAHGVVLRAYDSRNKQYVALKRMLSKQEETISVSALREIKSLQHVSSSYVMRLLGILTGGPTLILILELMAGGLGTVIYDVDHPVTVSQYKAYARMLLTGLHHLHQASIMHRDLKPANLLIGYDGILKIADLGQARLARGRPFSHQVGSRWYRAPELLYGSRRYSCAVDLWAVGCVLAEMVNKAPLFPGESDIEQLAMVTRSLGSPSEETWPGLRHLPDYDKISFPPAKGKSWKSLVPDPPPGAVDLIRALVTYNPANRLTAEQGKAGIMDYVDDVKLSIRAVMTSSRKDSMTYLEVIRDYEKLECTEMPTCGYRTKMDFINSIPDVLEVIPGPRGTLTKLRLVPSNMSCHIEKLVREQKPPESQTLKKRQFPTQQRLQSLGIRMPPWNSKPQNMSDRSQNDQLSGDQPPHVTQPQPAPQSHHQGDEPPHVTQPQSHHQGDEPPHVTQPQPAPQSHHQGDEPPHVTQPQPAPQSHHQGDQPPHVTQPQPAPQSHHQGDNSVTKKSLLTPDNLSLLYYYYK